MKKFLYRSFQKDKVNKRKGRGGQTGWTEEAKSYLLIPQMKKQVLKDQSTLSSLLT
jgi:hypothetical protein